MTEKLKENKSSQSADEKTRPRQNFEKFKNYQSIFRISTKNLPFKNPENYWRDFLTLKLINNSIYWQSGPFCTASQFWLKIKSKFLSCWFLVSWGSVSAKKQSRQVLNFWNVEKSSILVRILKTQLTFKIREIFDAIFFRGEHLW